MLSRVENAVLGTHLSEFHSGYRAYSVKALQRVPFQRNSNGFNFDTQIIVQFHDAGLRIVIPIPTYYGDEICYVDGPSYAWDVVRDVSDYRFQKAGFGGGSRVALGDVLQMTPETPDSYGHISAILGSSRASRVLVVGESENLSGYLRSLNHEVTEVTVPGQLKGSEPSVSSRESNALRLSLVSTSSWWTPWSMPSTPRMCCSWCRIDWHPTTSHRLCAERGPLVSAAPDDVGDLRLRPTWNSRC